MRYTQWQVGTVNEPALSHIWTEWLRVETLNGIARITETIDK